MSKKSPVLDLFDDITETAPELKAQKAPESVQEPVGELQARGSSAEPCQETPLEAPAQENDAAEPETAAGLPAALLQNVPPEEGGALTLARYAAKAYLEYALSVVKSRALPDVFDGMKPVQRRILYAMDRMRLAPPAKAVKCARVVGDVLGKYHPHGDQAAYDAMVRMAQDFSLRYPLVHGEGNFGSRDGDGPAAMRYTEARLTKIAELMLSELDSGDVDFVPNYDGSFEEPTLLPARLPFVLLNGASGIAVGMATEIPSHNLREVAEAVLLILRKPDATLEEVLTVLPAPDYPGGGQIASTPAEIAQIYRTGRGSLRVRARYHFEELQRGQWQLVVDELPPATNAEKVLTQIEELTNPKPRTGKKTLTAEQQQTKSAMLALLDGVRNECDKDTKMRIVFEPKTSRIDRNLFVNTLLTQTDLECNAPMNLVMLGTDGRPRQKGLLEILTEWVNARKAMVVRRTQARLEKVSARLHILEGRSIAIDNIDRVIEIVRFDEHPKEALMREFALSQVQAEDILELRLRQLANLEYERVQEEMRKLAKEAAELNKILSDETTLRNVVARETREAAKLYGDERRTLVAAAAKASVEQRVVVEPVTVVLSQKGFVRSRTGHGHDASLMNFKMGDALAWSAECTTEDTLILVGSNGRVYSVAVDQLPPARGDGLPITSFIDLEAGTEIVGCVAGPADRRVLLANDAGFGLMCSIGNMTARVRSGKAFMTLEAGDKIFAPMPVAEGSELVACLSEEGRMLVFAIDEIRTLTGGGKGVTLIDLNAGEKLIDCAVLKGRAVRVAGKGRTTMREKVIAHGDFERHVLRRARKGRALEIRFIAQTVEALDEGAAQKVPAAVEPQNTPLL